MLSASVALLASSASVVVDAAVVSDDAVLQAVDDAGFDVSLRSAADEDAAAPARTQAACMRLQLLSVACEHDADAAALLLLSLPGVTAARVTHADGAPGSVCVAEVDYIQHKTGPRTVLQALHDGRVNARLAPATAQTDANGAFARCLCTNVCAR